MTTEVLRNMIYGRSPALERLDVGGPRRGPLPPGRLPGPGLGGGHRPPAPPRCAWCACRPRSPTPPSWPAGSRPCGDPPPSSSSRPRPVTLDNWYLVEDRQADQLAARAHAGRRAGPTREGSRFDTDPRDAWRGRGGAAAGAGSPRPAGSRSSSCWPARELLPRHLLHLQPGGLRRRRDGVPRGGAALHRRRRARPHPRTSSSATSRSLTDDDLAVLGLRPLAGRRWRPGSPPTTPAWCRRSRRRSRPASSRAW